MKKRILSTLLAISMLFSFFPNTFLTAYAEALGTGTQLISALELTVKADGTIDGDQIKVTPTGNGSKTHATRILIMSAERYDDDENKDSDLQASSIINDLMTDTVSTFSNPVFLFKLDSFAESDQSYTVNKLKDNETDLDMSSSSPFGYSSDYLNTIITDSWEGTNIFEPSAPYNLQAFVFNANLPNAESVQIIPFTINLDEKTHVSLPEGGGPSPSVQDITSVTISGITEPTGSNIGDSNTGNRSATITDAQPSGAQSVIDSATKTVTWDNDTYQTGANKVTVRIELQDTDSYKFTGTTSAGDGWTVENVDPNGQWIEFSRTFNLAAEAQVITHIKGELTAPVLKTPPADNASNVQVAPDTSVYVDAQETSPTVKWSENAKKVDGKPAAGDGDYTATFTVTAPSGYKFEVGNNPTVDLPSGASSATAEVQNESTAEVTVTYAAFEKKATELKTDDSAIHKTDKVVGEQYTTHTPKITVTYNDGSTEDFEGDGNGGYASSSGGKLSIETDNPALQGVQDYTLTNDDVGVHNVYVKYTGDVEGVDELKTQIEELNVTYAPLGSVTVKVNLPTVGEKSDEINHESDGRNLTVEFTDGGGSTGLDTESTTIEWFDDAECDSNLGSATFPYGGEYYAKISIIAQADYKFSSAPPLTVTFENTDSSHSSEDKSTIMAEPISVTVDPDNYTALTAVFKVNMPAAPSIQTVEPSLYDYYDDSQNLTITLSRDLIDNLRGSDIQIGTDNVPATLTDQKTITVTAAEVRKFLQQKWGTGADNPLTASHVQEEWDIHIPIERSGNTIDGTAAFKAVNTTPYLTVEETDGGTIEVKEESGSALEGRGPHALKKGTNYTITAKPEADHEFSKWTGDFTDKSGDSFTYTPQASDNKTVNAKFKGPHKLTVNANNGTVTKVEKSTGSDDWEDVTAGGDSTYNIFEGDTYKITVTPQSDWKFNTDNPWTQAGLTVEGTDGTTGSDGAHTYTFTAGSDDVTVTANLVEDYKTVTINKTGNGTVTLTYNGGTTITHVDGDGDNVYRIKKSYGNVTITATAAEGHKLTTLDTPISAAALGTMTVTYDGITDGTNNKNVSVVFEAKVDPKWADGNTVSGAQHQPHMSATEFKYTYENDTDYEYSTLEVKKDGVVNAGLASSWAPVGKTITLAATLLDTLEPGTYTLTLTFTDKLNNGPETKTLEVSFTINGAPEVQSVTLPSNLKHGDNMGTFEFKVDNVWDGSGSVTKTYTYTVGTGWGTTPPADVKVNIMHGGEYKQANMDLSAFIEKYVQENTIVRFNKKSTDADGKATLCNGDSIAVGIGASFCTGQELSVTQLPVTLTVSGSNRFVKEYDGTTDVKDTLTWNASDTPINEDKTALGNTFTDTDKTTNGLTVSGTYQGGAGVSDSKSIKFTVTPDAAGHPDLDNYNITASDGTGKINKRPITVPAENFNDYIEAQQYNDIGSHSKSVNDFLKGNTLLVTEDQTDGIDITFSYHYKEAGKTDVQIDSVTADNYDITVSGDATGERAKRTVSSITVTPNYTATDAFYSSDKPDAKITIEYNDGEQDEYEHIADAKDATDKIESVKWSSTGASADGGDVNTDTGVTVAANDKHYIFVTLKSDAFEIGSTLTGSAAITVKPIPVTVTVSADKISKTYDGDDSFDGDTVKNSDPAHSNAFKYDVAVDTAAMGSTGGPYNANSVEVRSGTVKFAQKDVYSATNPPDDYDQIAKLTEATLSDTDEYTISADGLKSTIKAAEITPFAVTIKQIDKIKSVRVGAGGTRSGQAALHPASSVESDPTYQAQVVIDSSTSLPAAAQNDDIVFDITYSYDDTSTADPDDAPVTIHTIKQPTSGGNDNKNYTFSNVDDNNTQDIKGYGTVKEATISSITLTLPTSLKVGGDGDGHITYGDDGTLDFKEDSYEGLKVVINYGGDDNVTYELQAKGSGSVNQWKVTDTEATGTSGDVLVDFGKEPFELKWSGGTVETDPEALDLTKEIKWTYEENKRTLTASLNGKDSTPRTVNVNKKLLTVTPKYYKSGVVGDTADTPTKNYDKTDAIVPAGTWTYEITAGRVEGDDDISVALKTDKKPSYLSQDASTNDIAIQFGTSHDTNISDDDWDITGTNAGSYKIGTLADAKGKINKRPLKLVSITDIPFVTQFESHNPVSGAIASNVTVSGQAKATFAAKSDTPEGEGTGPIGDDQINITYGYQYLDTSTAGEVTDPAKLSISNVALQNNVTNYLLNDVTLNTLERQGTVEAAVVQSVEITEPTMYHDSQTPYAVQVGDRYDYAGLKVILHYQSMNVTYEPETYNAPDKGVKTWKVTYSNKPETPETGVSTVPFELTCEHSGHAQDEVLNESTEGVPDSGNLQVKIGEEVKAQTDDHLVVYPRRVTVTPNGTVSKTYDGTTTYTAETDGTITYTLTGEATAYTAASDKEGDNYKLPTTLSASSSSIAYAQKNAGNTNVNISNITLSSTVGGEAAKYAFKTGDTTSASTTSATLSATINKRNVQISEVHWITAVTQGQTEGLSGTIDVQTQDLSSTKQPYAKVSETTPVAGSDVLDITVNYTYTNTHTASSGDGDDINVTINSVAAKTGSDTEKNYIVTAAVPSVKGSGTVTAANYRVTVQNPNQFTGDGYTFDNDGLNVDGLTVTVTNSNVTTDTTTYYAVAGSDGNIEWRTDKDIPTTKVDDPPFTLEWSGTKDGASTTVTPGMKLPPAQYDGAQLTATLTKPNTDPLTPNSASGGTVKVNKKKISKVTASATTIEKVYNGNTTIEDEDKPRYTIPADQFVTGTDEGGSFTVTADAAYNNKHVGDGKSIVFTNLHATVTSDNYELASDASVTTTVTGKITAKPVDITDVYVPSITVDAVNPHTDIVKKGATAVSTSGTLKDRQVRASGFLPDEITYFTFDYTIVYREDDVKGNGGTTDVFVTLKDTNSAATEGAEAADVQATDYNIQWTTVAAKSEKSNSATAYKDFAALQSSGTGANKAEYLLGNVVADEYTEVSPPTDSGDKITSEVNPHTHGDPLDLTGLSIKVKSTTNYQTPATFTIGGTAGAQYWTKDGAKTVLPEGVTVTIGHTSITTEADLANLQAHYKNMNGEHITVSAPGAGRETITQQSEKTVVVKKAELTAEPSKKTDIDKYYDGTNEVKDNITYTVTGKKTFAGKQDEVNVTNASAPKYAGSDVVKLVDAVQSQNITFDLQLTGTDSENYTVKTIEGVTGKINPRTVVVSKLGANVKATPIEYKATTTTGTIPSVSGSRTDVPDKYIYNGDTGTEGEWPSSLNAPDVTISYDYGNLVNNTPGDVTINKTGSSDSFTMAFAAPTDNFVLNYNAVTTLPGTVTRAAIASLTVTKTKTDYYYGDKLTDDVLDDLTITVNGDTFTYYEGGKVNPKFADYGLTLAVTNGDGSTVENRDTDVLKNGTAQAKITVSADGGQSQDVNLTVNKRKLIVKSNKDSIDKTYDGTTAATDLGLIVAPKEEQTGDGYGLAAVDEDLATAGYDTVFTVTATGAMYTKTNNPVKDAWVSGDPYDITASVSFTNSVDIPTDQYELELNGIKGKINPKEVKLKPVLQHTYYIKNEAETITGETNYTADAFVSGEATHYNFTYTVQLSAETHNAAGDKSIPAAAADTTGYKSQSVSDGTDGYEWEITATNAGTYPLTNYTFTRADASITISNREFDHASIVETDRHMQRAYRSGEGVNFDNLEVRVYYKDDTTFYTSYVFGTESWNNSFEIVNTDGDTVVSNGTVLTTADDGTTYKVKIGTRSGGEAVYTDNATSPITVTANELEVTAVQSETASRAYDGTADASMFVKYEFTAASQALLASAGKTVNIASNTAAEVFTDTNPSYVGVDKPIGITANDSSFTLGGADAAQYTVKWVPPTGLKGTVTKLDVEIQSLPLVRAGMDSEATSGAEVDAPSASIGDDAKMDVVLAPASTMPEADKQQFSATWTAVFTAAQIQSGSTDAEHPETLTFKKDGEADVYPVVKDKSGSEDLFKTNYNFTWPKPRGIVVPSAIRISHSDNTPVTSVHGNAFNLDGIKFTVEYNDNIDTDRTFTFRHRGGSWQVATGNNIETESSFSNISDDDFANKYGIQLRWNATSSITDLVPSGAVTDYANRGWYNGKPIVIMVASHNGDGKYEMAATNPVTINPRYIYAFVHKYTDGTNTTFVQLDKEYDGTPYADPSGLEFEFYDYTTNNYDGNDAGDNSGFNKYTSPFAGETLAINKPAAGTQSRGAQLKAEYLGGTNESYKLGTDSWEQCNIEGKDVKRDSSGEVVTKKIQLSNLHLVNDYDRNYVLANADSWHLDAVTDGFDRYHPTDTKGEVEARNQVEGKITPKAMTVTVNSVPSIAKNAGDTTVNLTSSNYTITGNVAGDVFNSLKLTAAYSDASKVGPQTTAIDHSGEQADYPELDYDITFTPASVTGNVNDKGVTKLEITGPDKKAYVHGDTLDLKGTEITVTYSDNSRYEYTYDGTNTARPWQLQKYSAPDTADGDPELVSSPLDVTLRWQNGTDYVDSNEVMMYNAADKGYTTANNQKTAHIQVSSSLATTPGGTAYADPAVSEDITVARRPLGLSVTGTVTKVYDGNNNLPTDTGTLNIKVVNQDKSDLPTTLSVSYDMEAAKADRLKLQSTGGEPNSYVNDTAQSKRIYLGDNSNAIRNYIKVGAGDDLTSYTGPTTSGDAISNTAAGNITKRPITIKANTLPTLDLNTATPDPGETDKYTVALDADQDHFTIEGPDSGIGIMTYSDHKEAKAEWSITYDLTGRNRNEVTSAPITFNDGMLVANGAEDDTLVVGNYEPTWDENSITTAPVTPLAAAKGIEADLPQTDYKHGDHLDLTGMTVTVTKGDESTETYTYTADGWKKEDGTVVPEADLPFELYWTDKDGNDIDGTPQEAENEDTLSLTAPKNGATGDENADKTFHLSVRSKSDPTKHDEVDITVSKLQLKLFITGTATKVYDKTDRLVTYDIQAVLKTDSASADVVTLDDTAVDALVAEGKIKYGDTRTSTPASYVGTSAEKTITADLTGTLSVTLTDDNAKIYKLPASAETDIDVSGIEASITTKDIVFVVTEDTLAQYTYTEGTALPVSRPLTSGEYKVYEGAEAPAEGTAAYDLESGVTVSWTVSYTDIDETQSPKATIDMTDHSISGDPSVNYEPHWVCLTTTDKVTVQHTGDPAVNIVTQPTVPENPEYGDEPDWNGFEYEVKNPDGSVESKHKWDNENKTWVTTDGYTEPDPNTEFKWNNDTPVKPDDFKDITDKKLEVGDNKLTVTVPNGENSITTETNTFTASKRKITAKVTGLEDKVYDGTTAATGTPSITFDNAVDEIPTSDITVEFADKNVAVDETGAVTTKPVTVKGVTLPDELAGKYEIVNDPAGTDGITAESDAKITPREIKVVITAPAIKTDISDTAKTISKTGIGYSANAAENKYTLTGNTTLADGDTVTLKYSGTYQDITTGTKTTANKTTSAERDAVFKFTQAPAIENAQLANNYTLTYDITYSVTSASDNSSHSGGGGGGGGNSLTIYYELEDGKKGESVSKIEVPLGTDPTDLMAEIRYKLNDMTVLWSSDNEKVATVDENGIVTYVGEGQATITAVSKQNKQLKDTVKVTVTKGTASTTPTPSPTPTPDYENNKTDSLITGEMLNPYIVGYDDYVFGPELPISREELSAIFARLIANSIYMDKDYDTSFPDVPETWSKTYIGYLEGFNVVTGYEDGTFRPHNYITRAEMAVMMAKAEGYDISGTMDASELDFPDVDQGYSTWAVKAIKILTDKGIMQGYTDGTFRPGQPITRAETVATVNRVLADMEVADIAILPSDVTDAHWAYDDIVFAMNHRVLKDAAADPNKFIWSEQFDENMVKTNGKTTGTANDTPSEDNTSDGGADAPADSDQDGTTE